MAEQKTPVIGNPGFAGETGDFKLTEADVRGHAHVSSTINVPAFKPMPASR